MAHHGRVGEHIDSQTFYQVASIEKLWLHRSVHNPDYYQLTFNEIIVGIYHLSETEGICYFKIIDVDKFNIYGRETEKVMWLVMSTWKSCNLVLINNGSEEVRRLFKYIHEFSSDYRLTIKWVEPVTLLPVADRFKKWTIDDRPDLYLMITAPHDLAPIVTQLQPIWWRSRAYADIFLPRSTILMRDIVPMLNRIDTMDNIDEVLTKYGVDLNDTYYVHSLYPAEIVIENTCPSLPNIGFEELQDISPIVVANGVCVIGQNYYRFCKSKGWSCRVIDIGFETWNGWVSDRVWFE